MDIFNALSFHLDELNKSYLLYNVLNLYKIININITIHSKSKSMPTSLVSLAKRDPELHQLILKEANRQKDGLQLIASENQSSRVVRGCAGSIINNICSESDVIFNYYGNDRRYDLPEFNDRLPYGSIRSLCERRAKDVFKLNDSWEVQTVPYSGSPANCCVYFALLQPGDRIFGLSLFDGGHLTHGFHFKTYDKFTSSGTLYTSESYGVDLSSHLMDMKSIKEQAMKFHPKLVIAGASAYSRHIDWKGFRDIADACGAYLMVDMAHISGLVCTGTHPDPFPYADVVTSTTHKTLRGPRGAVIFYNRQRLGDQVANRVMYGAAPGLSVVGAPHHAQVAALCCQLKECSTDSFFDYQTQVLENCKTMERHFKANNFCLVAEGSDNHLLVVDTKKSRGVTGSKVEHLANAAGVYLNKNTVPGDSKPLSPSGIRIGLGAMTTRGVKEQACIKMVDILISIIDLAVTIQDTSKSKSLKDFKENCLIYEAEIGKINKLICDVTGDL